MSNNKKISTWRERIGQPDDFPLHVPTDVERAMVDEIADLRAALPVDAQKPYLWINTRSDSTDRTDRELYENIKQVEIICTTEKFGHCTTPLYLAAPTAQQLDDLIAEHRIAITPESEGGFHAHVYQDQEAPVATGYGATPHAAVDAALAAQQAIQPAEEA